MSGPWPNESTPPAPIERSDTRTRGSVLLRVPAALIYRELACRTVASICKLCEGNRGRADPVARFTNEFMSAVGEAFNNVVLHAYANRGDGLVDLELDWTEDQVALQMRDAGIPFNPDAVPVPDLRSPHEKGMGVYIIRSFVDRVDYVPGPPNVLVLTKRLNRSSPSSRAVGSTSEPPELDESARGASTG